MRVNGYPGTRIFKLFTFYCVMILFCLALAQSVSRAEDSDLSVFFGSRSGSFVYDVSHSKHVGRNLLDHEREDNHIEDDDSNSKGKDDDTQLKELRKHLIGTLLLPLMIALKFNSSASTLATSMDDIIFSVTTGKDAEDTVEDVDKFLHKLQNSKAGNPGFIHALVAALSVIIVSELGDKTFFIAAILAMRYSRLTVLLGALTALFIMTILSALVGYATTIIPRYVTYYISSLLFAVFGIKMLREGWYMSPNEGQEEYEEAQAEVKKREDEIQKQNMPTQDIETGIIRTPGRQFWAGILSTVFLESLTLTFLAEWGDRSQIATIILGAREDVIGVITGGLMGHALCTGLAVVGGRFVAQRISIRTVTLIGGVVFLVFAASAFIFGPES